MHSGGEENAITPYYNDVAKRRSVMAINKRISIEKAGWRNSGNRENHNHLKAIIAESWRNGNDRYDNLQWRKKRIEWRRNNQKRRKWRQSKQKQYRQQAKAAIHEILTKSQWRRKLQRIMKKAMTTVWPAVSNLAYGESNETDNLAKINGEA